MQTSVENVTNFLVHSAIKATRLSNSIGYLKLTDKGQYSQRMNSICYILSIYAQLKMRHPKMYYCEIAMQDACFDFTQDLRNIRA